MKGKNIAVNCDVKIKALMPEVINTISEFGMHDWCFFTGNTVPDFNAPTVHRFYISPHPQFGTASGLNLTHN
jgi:hypothetical protein